MATNLTKSHVDIYVYREEHPGEADGAGELPPREVPLEDEGDDERLDAREDALQRRVQELGRVLQQQGSLRHGRVRPGRITLNYD